MNNFKSDGGPLTYADVASPTHPSVTRMVDTHSIFAANLISASICRLAKHLFDLRERFHVPNLLSCWPFKWFPSFRNSLFAHAPIFDVCYNGKQELTKCAKPDRKEFAQKAFYRCQASIINLNTQNESLSCTGKHPNSARIASLARQLGLRRK